MFMCLKKLSQQHCTLLFVEMLLILKHDMFIPIVFWFFFSETQ